MTHVTITEKYQKRLKRDLKRIIDIVEDLHVTQEKLKLKNDFKPLHAWPNEDKKVETSAQVCIIQITELLRLNNLSLSKITTMHDMCSMGTLSLDINDAREISNIYGYLNTILRFISKYDKDIAELEV